MTVQKTYDEKFSRVRDTILRKIPDRVPIVPMLDTYIYSYANVDMMKAFTNDVDLAVSAFQKVTDDMYIDATLGNSNIVPFDVMNLFGEGLYTITQEGGLQIKGSEGKIMEAEDYPEFNKNVEAFLANEVIRRKYPILNQSFDANKELFIKAFENFKTYAAHNGEINRRIKEEVGLPLISKGVCYVAADIVLDFLRDFVGVSLDIRRHGDELLEALEGIHPYVQQLLYDSYPQPEDGFVVFSPLHLPTFLKPKDFSKFYFPFMKRYVEEVSVEKGYTILFYMENDWMPYLDILQDLPDKAKVVGLFEHGDMKAYKDRLGDKMTIMGGMPINLLKNGTKEQCLDRAKECLDLYAPGGNYIFSVDMVLMSNQDAKAENVIATFDYVRDNGKY